MNPDIKQQWIEALNSGEYEQTCGRLHDSVGYCCLGVLTDLYIKAHPGTEWREFSDRHGQALSTDPSLESAVLPIAVQCWAGLIDEVGTIEKGTDAYTIVVQRDYGDLASMNDKRETFRAIANVIKEAF